MYKIGLFSPIFYFFEIFFKKNKKKLLTRVEWYGIISLVADEDDKNLKKFLRKIKKFLTNNFIYGKM